MVLSLLLLGALGLLLLRSVWRDRCWIAERSSQTREPAVFQASKTVEPLQPSSKGSVQLIVRTRPIFVLQQPQQPESL